MIRQLTLAELTAAFGHEDAKKMFSQGQTWANIDLLTNEITTGAYTSKSEAAFEHQNGYPESEDFGDY